jgi:predicted nucleotidyltransferase
MIVEVAAALADRLATLPGVVTAYLFGSHARQTAGPLSDVDVAVLLDRDSATSELDVIAATRQAVAPRRADVVVLNDAPAALAFRVLRDGQLLIDKDEQRRVAHHVDVVDRYLDMAPMRRTLEAGLRHRILEGRFGRR